MAGVAIRSEGFRSVAGRVTGGTDLDGDAVTLAPVTALGGGDAEAGVSASSAAPGYATLRLRRRVELCSEAPELARELVQLGFALRLDRH